MPKTRLRSLWTLPNLPLSLFPSLYGTSGLAFLTNVSRNSKIEGSLQLSLLVLILLFPVLRRGLDLAFHTDVSCTDTTSGIKGEGHTSYPKLYPRHCTNIETL